MRLTEVVPQARQPPPLGGIERRSMPRRQLADALQVVQKRLPFFRRPAWERVSVERGSAVHTRRRFHL